MKPTKPVTKKIILAAKDAFIDFLQRDKEIRKEGRKILEKVIKQSEQKQIYQTLDIINRTKDPYE